MEYGIKGIQKSDYNKVLRVGELREQLEKSDLESGEREALLKELLVLLKQFARKYPVHFLTMDIAVAYLALGGRFGRVLLLLERLKNLSKDAGLHGLLGEAYLREEQLFCAYENMSFYIENSEEDVSGEYLSMFETLKPEYEKAYRQFVEEMGVVPQDQREHEKAQVLMHGGELEDARRIITALSKKYPHIPNVLNNLGIIQLQGGKLPESERHFRKVLSLDAENLFATAQLARIALYQNDISTVLKLTNQLMLQKQKSSHLYYELVQLNAYLGRDEKILSLFRSYDQEYPKSRTVEDGTIRFFGAVALLRTGNGEEGRILLRRLQKKNDILPHLTEENLADLRLPEEEQDGPAYFSLQNLFPHFFLPLLMNINDKTNIKKIRNILSQNKKMLLALLPVALRSGDELSREYFINMYEVCEWDEMYEPLASFMAGKAGSDEPRRRTFAVLKEKGEITGEVRMYQAGKETVVRSYRITEEPRDAHFTKDQGELNIRAFYLAQDGDTDAAIGLWEEYLQEHGDEPSVLNNLAAQYEKAGRESERDTLIEKLEKAYPDYFFLKISKAGRCIAASDFEQARTLLDSVNGRDEYHVSEMRALISTNIHYCTAKQEYQEAAQWYKTGSTVLPDDPEFNDPEELERLELMGRSLTLQKKGKR